MTDCGLTRFAATVCALAAWVIPVSAQTTPRVGNEEVRTVVVAAVLHLTDQIAAGVFAPASRPWMIHIPDSSLSAWRTARTGLYTMLRARPVNAADSSYTAIEFGPITFRGDTLVGSFGITRYGYCRPSPRLVGAAGLRAGSSEGYRVRAVRIGGFWQSPKVSNADIVDGGCMYQGKP